MGPSIRIDGEVIIAGRLVADLHWLQWGRRFASTERRTRFLFAFCEADASMGPSIRIDGEARVDGSLIPSRSDG